MSRAGIGETGPDPLITRKTFRLELARSPFLGILEAGWLTFGLTIATRVYDAPDFGKALIAAAFAIGLILNPIILYLLSYSTLKVATLCALLLAGSGLFLLFSAFSGVFWAFAFGLILSQMLAAQQSSLQIRIHSENYPRQSRGSRLSLVFATGSLAGALIAYFGGNFLDHQLDGYTWVLLAMVASCGLAALLTVRMPSTPLGADAHISPWKNSRLIWEDRLFGILLLAWMLMGTANLMIIPLRIEYLANPAYGINASVVEIATLTFVIPAIVRILSISFWGYLFDRTNFITLRFFLNTCFLLSVLFFFFTDNRLLMTIGAIFMGLGMGGGNIAWNLWVTKIAEPDKVSAYMSIHTGLTGVRGVFAPFLGFALIAAFGPSVVGIVAATLIFLSLILFLGRSEEMRKRQG